MHHVGAGRGRAVGERAGEAGRAGPHVVADDRSSAAPVTATNAAPGRAGQVLVELVGHGAADVVRLEDGVEVGGVARSSRTCPEACLVGTERQSVVQHAQVAAAGDLAAGPSAAGSIGTWAAGRRRGRAASRTASARASRSSPLGPGDGGVGGQPQDLPAAGGGEPLAVQLAQVVGVRLGVRRERAEDGGLVGVDVGQRVDRGATAGGARTATGEAHAPDATRRAAARRFRLAAVTEWPRRAPHPRPARPRACAGPAIVPARPAQPRAAARRRERFDRLVLDIVTEVDDALARAARPGGVRRRGHPAAPRRLGRRRPCRCRRWSAARAAKPTRLVLFRRPIEHRCETRAELEALVLTVVVEQVAELLGCRRGRRPALRRD